MKRGTPAKLRAMPKNKIKEVEKEEPVLEFLLSPEINEIEQYPPFVPLARHLPTNKKELGQKMFKMVGREVVK